MFYNLEARFYHHLTKGINVCDFIFASMDKETVSKWGLLLKEYFFLWKYGTNPYTEKSICGPYGKITGNQLPVYFPLFFTGARKHFQESGTVQ